MATQALGTHDGLNMVVEGNLIDLLRISFLVCCLQTRELTTAEYQCQRGPFKGKLAHG